MLKNKRNGKVLKRIASLVLVLIMVLCGLPGNLPYAVQAEETVISAGTLSVDGRSDLTTGNGDEPSTGSFYFNGTSGTLAGSLTAISQKGGVFFNGVMISNYQLTKVATDLYWFDYKEPSGTSLEPGDEIMISGEFSGVDSASAAVTVVFEKTVFQYLGTDVNEKGAWAIVEDSGEDKSADLISLEDFGETDVITANSSAQVVASKQSVTSLDGKTFVADVSWSHAETSSLGSQNATILYGSKGGSSNGIGITFWGTGTQLITRRRNGSWTEIVDHWDTFNGNVVDTTQPMRFKIRMDYIDSDLTDTDTTKNDASLNVWIEQNEKEHHVVKDRIFTDMTNLGGYVTLITHKSTAVLSCSNVTFEEKEEYLTFCDVGISDGTYSGDDAGVSTYTESLAGKTLVGDVSYEWLSDANPGSEYCSIAYGGTDQWSGVQFAYRFDQNIFIVVDNVVGSETYGSMPMAQDAWNLNNYEAETLGETRNMGIKMVYVDYDKDGSADDACFSISINNIPISENVYIKNGLYLLTNKIYVAPRNNNRSITVSSISTNTVATLSGTVLTVTGNGSLKSTILEEALAAAQITDKTAITEIRVEGTYSSIKENAFDGFTALERVFLTDSITQVADTAFVNCTTDEVVVSNAFGNEFTGGLANAKIVYHMSVDSVGEESSFENGTLTMHMVPTGAIAGTIDQTTYTGLKVQIDDGEPQAVSVKKTSYGTLAFELSGINKTEFAVTVLKGVAVTSEKTYTVQGFEFLEDTTFYVNKVAITDKQMAGVDVEAIVNETKTDGLYFTTQDNLPTGSWSAADNIYAVEGIENGVFVNGEPTEVFLRKAEPNTYYVCLADKNITAQDGDKVSVRGCFYYGDVMVHFAPFTAEYAAADSTWSKVTDTVTVEITEPTFVDGAAEDGGNYLVEEIEASTVLYESGDYDVTRTIGNVTFKKKVVIYKTGDANADNVVDVRDIVNIKRSDYTTSESGTKAVDTLDASTEDEKVLVLREQLVNQAESKADAVLPQLEGATGAGKYAADYITDVDATANGTTVLSITDAANEDKNYKSNTDYDAYGLDYVMDFSFSEDREIRILQLTDTQIVDSLQQRTEGRLDATQTEQWKPEKMDALVFSYIRETVEQTQPDLILLTGDNVHGEFDDNGECLKALIDCMEKLQIPWAPINGNHDNESIKGVQWQSEQYANAKYCLFNRRHAIGGNGNYSIGLAKNGELERVVYMLDSNYCGAKESTSYEKHADYGRTDLIHSRNEFLGGQMEWYRVSQLRVNQVAEKVIPSFCCFHVPDAELAKGLVWSGYQDVESDDTKYIIGEDGVIAQPGDSGYKYGSVTDVLLNSLYPYMNEVGCDGTFSGHLHYSSTSVYYKGIRWTLGTKTGEYVSHVPEKLGGTLISLENNANTGESFVVQQIIVTPTTE